MITRPQFTFENYPTILDAIELTTVVPLNVNPQYTEENLQDNWFWLGEKGNLFSTAWTDLHNRYNEIALKTRLNVITQPDGSLAVELKYYPNIPYKTEEFAEVYQSTKLSTLMTFEQFQEAVLQEDQWVEDCFGTVEIHEFFFEVVPTGGQSAMLTYEKYTEMLFQKPLPVTYQGQNYDLYVFIHED